MRLECWTKVSVLYSQRFGNEFCFTPQASRSNVVLIVCVGDVVFLLFDILLFDEAKHTLLMLYADLSFLLLLGI